MNLHTHINRATLAALYLEYVNDYLTLDTMAEHYSLTPQDLAFLLAVGKTCHESNHVEA
jgi:hypothetical protein